jgi:hypothetical protein
MTIALLIEKVQRLAARESSLFHAQLLREDVARLERLAELARSTEDIETFKRAGRRLGWTQGDLRTAELGAALDELLEAVFVYAGGDDGALQEARIETAWQQLYRFRIERLVGCLSTPAPKPE